MKNKFGVIILAAGSSARMGRPKQNLTFKNLTFLQRIASTAASLNCGPVIIVLGSNAPLFSEDYENAIAVINDNWQEGMASSICCGLKKLLEKYPSIEGAIITVCDQPYISAAVLNDMITTQQKTGKRIVACSYGEIIGPPALFHKAFFPEVMKLRGDAGARKIIQQNMDEVATVLFPQGRIDIDTEADYDALA
ncbi:MAG: nucleotidyltransferase family protein [Bacteroidetes bacterium]|nr:MAG: nucleotidyltransferase family protein [Bacteroidota bacterium]